MVFSTLTFLYVFFPICLGLYFLMPSLRAKNTVLLIMSLIFYAWGEPVCLLLIMFTAFVNYLCGRQIADAKDSRGRKRWLIVSVVVSLGLLFFFKYTGFLMTNLNRIPGVHLPDWNIALPIGISFYTFQAMSYTIDLYRDEARVQRSYADFLLYVSLFPQLIAGPIVRYQDVDDQLRTRTHSVPLFASGIRTFTAGLAKKVLLANAAGEIWSNLSASSEMTVVSAWLGIIMYTFQIYFDFSGYSDMAIGLGKMMGFSFRENFYYPYMADSVTDFWRRWHISLSTWFREYVYIPLGGNRRGRGRQIFNLFVVWFLTGLWHGASWNYVLWGLYYFVLLLLEKTVLLKLFDRLPRIVRRVYTLLTVVFGWWLFVFEDFTAGLRYLAVMFGGGASVGFLSAGAAYDLLTSLVLLAIFAIAATPYPRRLFYRLWEKHDALMRTLSIVLCAVGFLLSLAYLVNSSYNPFLYYIF